MTTVNNPLSSDIPFKIDARNYLELKPLDIRSSITLIEKRFKNLNRELTDPQWLCVKKLFVQSQTELTPLYLKVIFNIIKTWPSFFNPENDFQTCYTTKDCIKYIFNFSEKLNGRFFFLRCIFYLTIFEYGLSESELEDILCIDDELLSNLFQLHAPKARRFPVSYWAKMKYDLSDFVITREFDDLQVISW
jgi:hypothetical protein